MCCLKGNRTLSFDVAYYIRYRIFRRYTYAHMYVVEHQVAFRIWQPLASLNHTALSPNAYILFQTSSSCVSSE